MADIKEIIGKKLKDYRMQFGDTQEAFSQKLGINRSSLSLIEKGEQAPDIELLVKIIRLTKMDIQELLELNYKTHIVVDTNIILNSPSMLNFLKSYCDYVYIPETVIKELNFQKDRGTEAKRKLASLCLNKITELKSDKFIIANDQACKGENHDDKIFAYVKLLASSNRNDMVYLLTNDKDFKLKNSDGLTNLRIIESKEADAIFRPSVYYNIPKSQKFFEFVSKKNLNQVKGFNKDDIDLNFIDLKSGYTPLIQAIRNKDIDMVEYLIALPGTDLNKVDNKKYCLPPLSHAIQMHNLQMMKLLIINGANVNEPSTNDKNPYNTPIMIASWSGKLEEVKLLVESGACINQQDKGNGFTALIKAVFNNNIEVVKYLLDQNADITISSFERKTALDYAYEKKFKELISMLKEKI